MLTTNDLLDLVKGSPCPDLRSLQKAILNSVTSMVLKNTAQPEEDNPTKRRQHQDRHLMNMLGPAAASAAVENSIQHLRRQGKLRNIQFTGSYIQNTKLIQNDEAEPDWSSTLRQYLLPRYAYLDFDNLVDPRHPVDAECGYPKFISPVMYRYMYDRDDMGRRVGDVYANESWAADPLVWEDENENNITDFEKKWLELCEDHNLLSNLYRLDKLCGIGHYGVMLVGLDDGKDLEEPVDEPELLAGKKNTVGKKKREIIYLRPFDEYLSYVSQYELNTSHPRYGMPVMYNLVFLDMTIDAGGSMIGTRINRKVHWSRLIHVADNQMSSTVFGIPRMQSVFNRLLDLRKIKGCGAEGFWKAAFPGLAFEVDPKFLADNPDFDKQEFKDEVEGYFTNLQRALFMEGIKATTLNPTISDSPDKYVKIQMEAISSNLEMPLRVFMGSEEGRLASSQDMTTWNRRLGRRCRRFLEPEIMRNTVNRFIALGVMPPPKMNDGRYFVEWPDLDNPTDEDKANLSIKWTQALSQYVSSGMIHLIEPMDYFTMIMGLRPSQAKKIVAAIEANGGWAKLKAVDPAQGSGVNGKAESNLTPGQKSGTGSTRPKERNTADKKTEGSSG